jgi:hypothetical protein
MNKAWKMRTAKSQPARPTATRKLRAKKAPKRKRMTAAQERAYLKSLPVIDYGDD